MLDGASAHNMIANAHAHHRRCAALHRTPWNCPAQAQCSHFLYPPRPLAGYRRCRALLRLLSSLNGARALGRPAPVLGARAPARIRQAQLLYRGDATFTCRHMHIGHTLTGAGCAEIVSPGTLHMDGTGQPAAWPLSSTNERWIHHRSHTRFHGGSHKMVLYACRCAIDYWRGTCAHGGARTHRRAHGQGACGCLGGQGEGRTWDALRGLAASDSIRPALRKRAPCVVYSILRPMLSLRSDGACDRVCVCGEA